MVQVCFLILAPFTVQPPGGAVVSTVVITGVEGEAARRAQEDSGLAPGQPVDKERLDAVVRRMFETGRYEQVRWRYTPGEAGWAVTLMVRAAAAAPQAEAAAPIGEKVSRMLLEGVSEERRARVEGMLSPAMEGRLCSAESVGEVGSKLVSAALAEAGHWSPEMRFECLPGGTLRVLVKEGEPAVVGDVRVPGADAAWLERAAFPVGAKAESAAVNRALGRLMESAREAGYLNASARMVNSLDGGRLNVNVELDRGVQYRFGELKIEGLDEGAEKRARALWRAKPGAVAAPSVVEEWIREVIARHISMKQRVQRRMETGEDGVARVVVTFQ